MPPADLQNGAFDPHRLTREIFGNIPGSSKWLFYFIAAISVASLAWAIGRRIQSWRSGRSSPLPSVGTMLHRVYFVILGQRRFVTRPTTSIAHRLVFYGFSVLFLGTCLVAVEHVTASLLGRDHSSPVFHWGYYYGLFEVVLELAGLAFLIGVVMFFARRLHRPSSLDHRPSDWLVLILLATIGITGYLVEGARILVEATPYPQVSFVGLAISRMIPGDATSANVAPLHLVLWWIHALLALGLLATLPYTRLWHLIAGSLHVILTENRSLGAMEPVGLEQLERDGFIGIGTVDHLSVADRRMVDACVACGRCEEVCPATIAGKPLSPKAVVQDIASAVACAGQKTGVFDTDGQTSEETSPQENGLGNEALSLHDIVTGDTVWSCTTCSACSAVCPLGIRPVDLITDLRRYLVCEGALRGAPATALQKTQRSGNPWGLPANDRFQWAEGLHVPTVDDVDDFELLYWVGCAAAYDRRAQRVARATVKLLHRANVLFAVLGPRERCTGECARRMGDEFLFQELADQNLTELESCAKRRIVTHCPHCLNSLKRDYRDMGLQLDVVHHSVLLAELLEQGRLPRPTPRSKSITYHDPCYLARAQGVTDAPRTVLQSCGTLHEPIQHREMTACCGAGGGRMWFDDKIDTRVGRARVDELMATKAETTAVGCPFCLTMLTDGIAHHNANTEVRDLAEILAEALELS